MLTAGFSLVNFGLLARSLEKEEFGFWTFFLTIFGLFDMIRNGLVGRPMVKMSSEGDENYFKSIVTSAFRLCWMSTGLLILFVALVFTVVWALTDDSYYLTVSAWFAACSLISIPSAFASWIGAAKIKFQRVVLLNGSKRFLFMIGSLVIYLMNLDLYWVFVMYFLSNLITSLLALILRWTYLLKSHGSPAAYVKKIFSFGKFSMGTMLGGSALTSSDNLLIMTFLGPEALAVYSVPMRIIGLYDIPLRALVQIAFPTLAKVRNEHGDESFAKEFEKSNGFTFLVLLPVSILIFVFADPIIVLIGGAEYVEAAMLLRIFSLYLLITPLDRFAGIALDVLNYPNRNFKKMMLMLLVNIIGDLCAIYFGGGITYVAVASIGTFALGTVIGFYYLRDRVPFKLASLLVSGKDEILRVSKKLLFK